jgi:pimeloyl-ACP methyl ester carboxylesterase
VTSTPHRDRLLTRLRKLPTVMYPDRATAIERFRLMPEEGEIAPGVRAEIAERSLERTADGRYTLKFDRASFIGSDGLDVRATIRRIGIPTLLIRAELSRIMTAAATTSAAESNPCVREAVIPGAHHHVLLEHSDLLGSAIAEFAVTVG